jgi:hypothetical protein
MKQFIFIVSVLLVGGLLWGCGSTSSTNNPNANALQYYNITGSLQGKIMDAITGDPVGGSNLKVYLIQGSSVRGPSMLITDPNNPLCGNYAFSGIPADVNTGEIRYRVVVSKQGYQDFEGDVELQATVNNTTNAPIVDNQYNMIGDIYLYPEGSSPANLNVYVYDPTGLPISNATVHLKQNVINNFTITPVSGDRLAPMAGLYSSLDATTNAQGLATFTSGTLVLGGAYYLQVASLTFNGEILNDRTFPILPGMPIQVGIFPATFAVHMVPSAMPLLYVVTASNSVPSVINPSGVLTLTFNQPVMIDTTLFTAALSGGSGGTLGTPAVNATLSADGMTLTLTPNFTANATAAGATITYGYTGIVRLQNNQTVTFPGIFGSLQNAQTMAVVNGTVLLVGF